jgi:hypothetical protein
MTKINAIQLAVALFGALFLAGLMFPANEIIAGRASYSWSKSA